MKYRQRTFYTAQQKSEMWGRWQRGEPLSSIGRRFDRASSSMATKIDVYFCDPQSPLSADCYAIACRAMRGKEGVMKTPIDFFASTSRKALIYRALAKHS